MCEREKEIWKWILFLNLITMSDLRVECKGDFPATTLQSSSCTGNRLSQKGSKEHVREGRKEGDRWASTISSHMLAHGLQWQQLVGVDGDQCSASDFHADSPTSSSSSPSLFLSLAFGNTAPVLMNGKAAKEGGRKQTLVSLQE